MLGTEIKTNNCKRLATAVAIFAILVCCLAVAVPSMSDGAPDYNSDESEATVTNYPDLNTALDNSRVDTIFINGTIGSATNYITIDVDRAVTIQPAANATATIYGAINVYVNDVTINGLNINTTYMTTTERNGINVLADAVTITDCTFTMDENSTNLSNGIFIWPTSAGSQDYNISGNTFNNYLPSESWNSNAISVATNLDKSGYSVRFGTHATGTTATIDMTEVEIFRMVADNTFVNCITAFSCDDYGGTDVVGMRVVGDVSSNLTQSMDYYTVSGTTYTLLNQGSDSLSLSFNSNETFIVASGVGFNGEVTFTVETVRSTVNVSNLVAGGNGVTFKAGSVEISGNIVSGTGNAAQVAAEIEAVSAPGAEVVLSGLNITSGTLEITGDLSIEGVVTVAEGATLSIQDDTTVTVQSDATFNVGGTVETAGTNSVLWNNGTIALISEDAVIPSDIDGTGSIDTSGASSEAGLRGDLRTDTVFTEQQIVNVDGNLTLVAGTQLVIRGTLVIPEGITVTIQEGAQLIIMGQAANVQNNGTIIVESDDESASVGTPSTIDETGGLVIAGGNFVNNGTITAQYIKASPADSTEVIIDIQNGAAVENNGTITIGAESGFSVDGTVKNASGATITMNGAMDALAGTIENSGTITINGTIRTIVTITLKAADATVNVPFLSTGAASTYLCVEADLGTTRNPVSGTAGFRMSSTVDFAVGGVVITAKVVTGGTGSTAVSYNALDVSGTTAVTYTGDTVGTLPRTDSSQMSLYGLVLVSDELIVSQYNSLNLGGNSTALDLRVSGNMTVGTFTDNIVAGSEITVAGLLQTYIDITSKSGLTVNAANYRVANTGTDSATNPYIYNYTTLESAIAAGATAITVTGQIEVTADVTVPSGTTVTQLAGSNYDGKITVGEDVTMTFATGSRLVQNGFSTPAAGTYNGIDVEGTLYVEDTRNTLRSSNPSIYSQVRSSTGSDAMYTSLVNAMDAATEGSNTVIELYNKAVSIDRTTFTIKAGVTVDTNGQNFTVNGSTLIINGTLFIDGGTYDVRDDTTTTPGYTYEGNVVLNGYIRSSSEIAYNDAEYPAGAYYIITTSGVPMYYATTVANAAGVIGDVDNRTVYICGTLTTGDVSFTGTVDEPVFVIIDDGAEITAGTITIDEATVTLGQTSAVSLVGTIASSEGSVSFARNTVISAGATVQDITTTANGVRLILSAITDDSADGEGNTTIAGTVYIGAASDICHLTVDGTAQIAANGVRVDEATVNGTLNVMANSSLIAGTIYVNGTLSTAVSTAEAPGQGTITVTELYVGIDRDDEQDLTQGAVADVIGNVSLATTNDSVAYVASGSTIPENFADYNSTAFYVEDALWMTAYGSTAKVDNAPVQNAEFVGWNDSEGTQKYDVRTSANIPLDAQDALYADVDYNVYYIMVNTDGGINSVAVDGIILTKNSNSFTNLPSVSAVGGLTAGTHTLSFTMKNGYEGTIVMTIDGTQQSGYSFELSGDYGVDNALVINLTGSTPTSGSVVIDNGGSDMGLTDYLLIILVVLIVIMAIMVAMRLMRS